MASRGLVVSDFNLNHCMRIASLISAGTEMLYWLGLGDQVVAVSHECDWPGQCASLPRVTRSNVDAGADSLAIDRQVRSIVAASQPLYEVDSTLLAQLQPDLIVTQAQCDVCAVRYDDVLSAVRREPRLASAQVIALNPQSLDDVFADMLHIGALAGMPDAAEEAVSQLRRRVERIRAGTSGIPASSRPRTAIIEWREPLMLAGNWVPELLALAGGCCELNTPGEHSRCHTWDEVVRFDPEVVLVCPCGFDHERAVQEVRALGTLPGWRNLTAVRAGRVNAVDGNAYFNRPGPRLVDSLELLAALLHPDRFPIPDSAATHYSSVDLRCK